LRQPALAGIGQRARGGGVGLFISETGSWAVFAAMVLGPLKILLARKAQ